MSRKFRTDRYIDKADLPAFFRTLADALEGSAISGLPCLDDFHKLKISVKDMHGQTEIRLKINARETCDLPPDDESTTTPQPKPRYADLKERMKQTFRMLFKMIHNDQMPPAEAVTAFIADSHLMVTYPGYGDEAYDEYITACTAFAEAYAARDMARLNETIDRLAHQKGHCHAKFG